MTLHERAAAYNLAWSRYPASALSVVRERGGFCLYGIWLLGNNYRNRSRFYGAYPPGFIERVSAMFPDVEPIDIDSGRLQILHAFSGSLPKGSYVRCDVRQDAELQQSVYDLDPIRDGRYALVFADPPYSTADAERYGTSSVDRRRAMAALARVTRPGGFLVWLDTVWPMFSKRQWRTVGRIALVRSTNHRVRLISIFERGAAEC